MHRVLRIAGIRLNHSTPRPIRDFGSLPRSIRALPAFTTNSINRRYYSDNPQNFYSNLQSGNVTKSDVLKMALTNEHMKQRLTDMEKYNRTLSGNTSPTGTSTSMSSNSSYSIHGASSSSLRAAVAGGSGDGSGLGIGIGSLPPGSSIGGTVMGLGSKANPVYMRRQTTFREFIFSLFPFLFIFWMLGGFDLVKNRKTGGVGGMFGKNYSEWDETDWEDDDDEITPEEESTQQSNNNSLLKKSNESESTSATSTADNKSTKSDTDTGKKSISDRRREFFRRLGINLSKSDEDKDSKKENDTARDVDASFGSPLSLDTGGSDSGKAKRNKQKRVRFRDVCGCEEAKMDLQDLVDYLKNPEKYQAMGCKLPKGVLMSGSPGTGKTLLARALAGEAGVPFLATNGASFDEIFVGVGVMRVRKLFERAAEKAPCIVFVDEIDAIANTRMQMGTAHSSDSLNALLSEMDGFEKNTGIIVIAATNMPDRLDPALVRPGRFDRKVHIQLPDRKARAAIVKLYLKDRAKDDVDVDLLVSDVSGFSGAELESMVNLASIECVKQSKNAIEMAHLTEAKEIIAMGRARRSMEMSELTKSVTAYHESGHALVSLYTLGSKPIYKATILPRGGALGFVASSNSDEYMSTKQTLLAQLDTCMGGRAAEEIASGLTHVTTGASSDFSQATSIASAMVCQYGMSAKVGRVFYRSEDIPKLSPQLQNLINSEVKRLLDESYNRAKHILHTHRSELESLAKELLTKETLSGERIKEVIKFDASQILAPIDTVDESFVDHKSLPPSISHNRINKAETTSPSTDTTDDDKVREELQRSPILTPQTELLNPQT